jgi:hypothetical protein
VVSLDFALLAFVWNSEWAVGMEAVLFPNRKAPKGDLDATAISDLPDHTLALARLCAAPSQSEYGANFRALKIHSKDGACTETSFDPSPIIPR